MTVKCSVGPLGIRASLCAEKNKMSKSRSHFMQLNVICWFKFSKQRRGTDPFWFLHKRKMTACIYTKKDEDKRFKSRAFTKFTQLADLVKMAKCVTPRGPAMLAKSFKTFLFRTCWGHDRAVNGHLNDIYSWQYLCTLLKKDWRKNDPWSNHFSWLIWYKQTKLYYMGKCIQNHQHALWPSSGCICMGDYTMCG